MDFLYWASQQHGEIEPPPPAEPLSIITLGFSPGDFSNIVWFGFGAVPV